MQEQTMALPNGIFSKEQERLILSNHSEMIDILTKECNLNFADAYAVYRIVISDLQVACRRISREYKNLLWR